MAERHEANHDPTTTRLRRAERTGQFARSRELAVAITWLGGAALLITFGSQLWKSLDQLSRTCWASNDIGVSANDKLGSNMVAATSIFWSGLLPLIGGVAFIAIISWSAQSGFRFYPHLAAPDIGRINPIQNMSRAFRFENFFSVMLGLAKFGVLTSVAVWVLLGDFDKLAEFSGSSLALQSKSMAEWLMSVVVRLCLASVAIGLLDYGVRWQLNRRSLRMTDQEIRDEQRTMESSPEVGARRRLMQQR